MDSQKTTFRPALLLLPLAALLSGPAAAQTDGKAAESKHNGPDLVITEDTQLGTRVGKAIIGSCEENKPLWEGKIAIKNIGRTTVEAKPAGTRLEGPGKSEGPHIRAYVPNNIELRAEEWLKDDLAEFGQELVPLSIGLRKPKCRNYDAPPVFDERVSGQPGPPPYPPEGPVDDGIAWRVKKIQAVLIDKGYALGSGADGDYGPKTIKAILAFFKDRKQDPPPGVHQRPPPPETLSILLDVLDIASEPPPAATHASGGSECTRGINLVPIYLEIDPERKIEDENTSNNRVQFTVAIDCKNIAR
jgi:hypothetical protein